MDGVGDTPVMTARAPVVLKMKLASRCKLPPPLTLFKQLGGKKAILPIPILWL